MVVVAAATAAAAAGRGRVQKVVVLQDGGEGGDAHLFSFQFLSECMHPQNSTTVADSSSF